MLLTGLRVGRIACCSWRTTGPVAGKEQWKKARVEPGVVYSTAQYAVLCFLLVFSLNKKNSRASSPEKAWYGDMGSSVCSDIVLVINRACRLLSTSTEKKNTEESFSASKVFPFKDKT